MAPRKKKEKTETISVRLTLTAIDSLRIIADREDRAASYMAGRLVCDGLTKRGMPTITHPAPEKKEAV